MNTYAVSASLVNIFLPRGNGSWGGVSGGGVEEGRGIWLGTDDAIHKWVTSGEGKELGDIWAFVWDWKALQL